MERIAVMLLNMGGPKTSDQTFYFLKNLFTDPKIIKLPFQSYLGPLIAKLRSSKVEEKYNQIGGGSPIHHWTIEQSRLLENKLNTTGTLENKVFKCFHGFQYVPPHIDDTLSTIIKEKFDRIILFPQYMHYSCTTSGSCMNYLMNSFKNNSKFPGKLHLIDRWFSNKYLVEAFQNLITSKLKEFPQEHRKDVFILFSAHSLPQYVVERGDTYPWEVATTVNMVMEKLNFSNPYRLVWQSKVGFLKWLTPSTFTTTQNLAKNTSIKGILIVPISFTSDHIETLHEIDIELKEELKKLNCKIDVKRTQALNDSNIFINCLENEINKLMNIGTSNLNQIKQRCPGCTDDSCLELREFVEKHLI